MARLEEIVQEITEYHPGADVDMVRRAYEFAAKAHEGQTRRSGDPYVSHPLSVAGIIVGLKLDVASICAGLLHDAVEDTSATVQELERNFGVEVASLVDGVTKLGKLPYSTREERQAENFRKMLLAMSRDIRVILLKFCDRLDNMRTLEHMPPEKQERIASETLHIYAPLAHRLGIDRIKCELEDLCFRYLYPEEYQRLRGEFDAAEGERLRYIADVEMRIHDVMEASGIPCRVLGGAKHLWSIRRKMKRAQSSFEEVHDAIGFRIITDTAKRCYEVLGVVHASWKPIPGRFKDFIALPKPNLYQSLHTAVIGPQGERMEILIRTEEMHLVAQQGIAARWKYKDGKSSVTDQQGKLAWLRQMTESQQDVTDPTEFIEAVKVDLYGDEVYVFTPQGDVKALPKGACPIDFAYAVHTNVGDHCSGARVNNVIVPLRYQLRNGDTAEIITSPNQKPSGSWLKLVKTARARTRIRHQLRLEERNRARALGKDLLNKGLKEWKVSFETALEQGELARVAGSLSCCDVEELLCRVGYGKVTAREVALALSPELVERTTAITHIESEDPQVSSQEMGTDTVGIRVEGRGDVLVRVAKCCSPLPGDHVVGFLTHGRGVEVHRRDCTKALDLNPDRRIPVEWTGSETGVYDVAIQVTCADQPGLLAHISQAFTDSRVNITQAHCLATEDGRAVNTFHVNVGNLGQLKAVMRSLMNIHGVYNVERARGEL